MMELGGNRRFNEFMAEQGIPVDMPIREKYRTRAAKWYRENLAALAEGLEPPAPLPQGTGHLPVDSACSSGELMMDKVFSDPSHRGSLKSAGIKRDYFSQSRDDLTEAKPLSMCQRVAACFKQCCGPIEVQSCPRSKDLDDSPLTGSYPDSAPDQLSPVVSLPQLLGSEVWPTAKRLQGLSSGKMKGFGSM